MIDQAFPSDGTLPANRSFSISKVLIDLSTVVLEEVLEGAIELPNGMKATKQTNRSITHTD